VVSITPRLRFTPGERTPGTHWAGGWVGPRAGLEAETRRKVLCLCQGLNPGHLVHSQSLYWLSYLGSWAPILPNYVWKTGFVLEFWMSCSIICISLKYEHGACKMVMCFKKQATKLKVRENVNNGLPHTYMWDNKIKCKRSVKLMLILFQAWFDTSTQSEVYIHGKFQSRRSWINKISRKWCM
jgi:hypothetical protein